MTKETRSMTELDKEIEEMENAFLSTPEEPAEEPVVEESTPKVPTPELQTELDATTKRFNNYKGSTDRTLFELRTKVKDLEALITSLSTENAQLKAKPESTIDKSITSYLSKEDQEVLGDSAVSALDKSIKEMVNSQVDPLKTQLDSEAQHRKALEKRNEEQVAQQRYQQFISNLTAIVPDFQDIVGLTDFRNRYLKEADEYSGIQREKLFVAAEDDGDVSRVASFFTDYKSFLKGNDNVLEQSITPKGQGSGPVIEGAPKWEITPNFITKFYDDVNKGTKEYKGKQGRALALEIETAIDEFIMNGGHHRF